MNAAQHGTTVKFYMNTQCRMLRDFFPSFCYLSSSRIKDKRVDIILSTVCAVTRKRWAELAHR